jgi:uncharacterized protein YbjT (DUF2867 family)
MTGATGYVGRQLVPKLLERGHSVRALVRDPSRARLPPACDVVVGNALDRRTFEPLVAPADTFVHLVGTPHPSPAKAAEFRRVDLVSIQEAVPAAVAAGVRHFVYVSVAHPAPVMDAYIAVRSEGEVFLRASGLSATILRPWYILGPGHRWPVLLLPIYWVMERLPSTREGARRLGLVTIDQFVATLVRVIEQGSQGIRIVEVPEIRRVDG